MDLQEALTRDQLASLWSILYFLNNGKAPSSRILILLLFLRHSDPSAKRPPTDQTLFLSILFPSHSNIPNTPSSTVIIIRILPLSPPATQHQSVRQHRKKKKSVMIPCTCTLPYISSSQKGKIPDCMDGSAFGTLRTHERSHNND